MSGFPATATYASLAEEIISGLQGSTVAPDQMTVLSASLTSTATAIPVEDATQVGAGVIEIGDELVYAKSVDEASNTVNTNAGWRGFRGTLAEAHAAGETVRFRPTYPRSVVKREINNILLALYPTLFAVKAVELDAQSTSPHYELPAEAAHVVDVRAWRSDQEGWFSVKAWSVEQKAPSTFATGVTLNLFGIVEAGLKLQVLYATAPARLVNDADVFATVTGLPESSKDVVVYGVQYRLAQAQDLARIATSSVSSEELAQSKPAGSALQIASAFGKQYQAALERERMALNVKYPARIHKVR